MNKTRNDFDFIRDLNEKQKRERENKILKDMLWKNKNRPLY